MSIAFVMELTLVPLFLPTIQAEFGLTIRELTWFFNSYGIAVAVGVLLGGWLGDQLEAKMVFAVGVLCFALGSAFVALAESYQHVISARALQGFGGGMFSPLVPVLLTRASPDKPGKILILWGSVAGYAAALAPLLYSRVLVGFGWGFAFGIFAVVSLAALAVVQSARIPTETRARPAARKNQVKALRTPDLWLMFGYIFCTYGAISFYLFCIPIRLAQSDVSVVSIGFALSIMWLTFSTASALLRNAVDEPHIRSILTIAPVFIAVGFGLAYYADTFVLWAVSSMLVGAGLACSNAPSTMLVLKFAPKGTSALSASLDISFARVGGVVTILTLAQSMPLLAVTGVSILSALALLFAYRATKKLHQIDNQEREMISN
ncbi:MFS transporter [Loktanella sp. Alg231-35]|uniref:MFS transporter n=1 Tax=Loktanella sp. Alg231-35 TaxID=1922220 RepID=UPI00131F46E0|nr:MFS transporter [Loktanella sp. Alg231-35]